MSMLAPATEAANPRSNLGFVVIGLMKLGSAVLLAAAGFGIFRMVNRDLGASLDHLVSRLHLDPDNQLIHEAVARVSGINPKELKALGVGTFFYAGLHMVEGTGLVLRKHWAEYLTVFMTGSLLPVEAYEIYSRPTALRIGVMAVNLAILVYLLWKIRQQHSQRN